MAMWSVLGARGTDVLAWGCTEHGGGNQTAQLDDCRIIEADWGDLPDLGQVDFSRDVLFTFNGTTSGVRGYNLNWIRMTERVTIADATCFCDGDELDQAGYHHLRGRNHWAGKPLMV